jgi:hypothetical protein
MITKPVRAHLRADPCSIRVPYLWSVQRRALRMLSGNVPSTWPIVIRKVKMRSARTLHYIIREGVFSRCILTMNRTMLLACAGNQPPVYGSPGRTGCETTVGAQGLSACSLYSLFCCILTMTVITASITGAPLIDPAVIFNSTNQSSSLHASVSNRLPIPRILDELAGSLHANV